jgi:hypothetical protein
MTAYSTQGKRLATNPQIAFGTPQLATLDVRPEGEFTVKSPSKTGVVPQTIHADVNETEKPITLQRAVDDAVQVKALVRQALAPGSDSFLKKAYESGGMSVVSGNDTTITTYTDTSSFVATDDNFGVGYGVVVELDNGQWVPTLIKDYSAGTITPAMALPSASSTTNALNKCLTITPGDSAEITASKLLTFKEYTKANGKSIQWQDCAVTSYDEVVMTPGEVVLFGFTFGSSKFTEGTDGLGSNTFGDATAALRFNSPYFEFANANANAAIASTLGKLITATFSVRNTAMQIPATGDTTSVNDICGWIKKQDTTQAYLTIEQLFTQTEFDAWNGSNTSKHIAITQPGNSETDPSFSIVLPNAHQVGEPEFDQTGDMYRVNSTYVAKPSGFSGTTSSDQGNQPWHLLLGEKSA